MTPQQEQKLNEVLAFIQSLKASATIPYEVDSAFRDRLFDIITLPDGFEDAPLASVAAPSGGLTIDAEARTAIDLIITRLEDLGLIADN